MSIRKVTALVLAAMIAGVVLGGMGIANATSKATSKPAVQACQQGQCPSTPCPPDPALCDKSQRGGGACNMSGAAAPRGIGDCNMSGAASSSNPCSSGACEAKQ